MKSQFPRVPARSTHPVDIAASATDAGAAGLSPLDTDACLSALVDGEASAVQQACAHWRDDARARLRWHTYHLIGDVMRSDELAARPAHDADFLAALRVRLAVEPVVLAPAEPVRTAKPVANRRPAWLMPAAAAAGFVVVAGVLVVARVGMPGAGSEGQQLAGAQNAQTAGVQRVSGAVGDARSKPLPGLVQNEGLIRDARLDEYLRAHQAARGGVAVAQPGGTMRRVEGSAIPVSIER